MLPFTGNPHILILLVFLLLPGLRTYAQQIEGEKITVSGNVFEEGRPTEILPHAMIINFKTGHGFFGKSDGTFRAVFSKNDTIIIASSGYANLKICFRDSVLKEEYVVSAGLKKLAYQLPEVKVFAPRDMGVIEKEIQKLGYSKRDYQLSGVDAISSPITFLYQEFSSREQQRRRSREFVNIQKGRELLKELLHIYVEKDIIKLDDDDFDAFINYANASEEFMQTATQYDFIMYIKKRYMMFAIRRDRE